MRYMSRNSRVGLVVVMATVVVSRVLNSCCRRKVDLPSKWKRIHCVCKNWCSRAAQDESIIRIGLTCSSAAGLEGDRDTDKQRASQTPAASSPHTATTRLSLRNVNKQHKSISHRNNSHPQQLCTADRYKANPAPGLCSLSPTVKHETLHSPILENPPSRHPRKPSDIASFDSIERVRDPVLTTAAQLNKALPGPARKGLITNKSTCRLQAASSGVSMVDADASDASSGDHKRVHH
jgi:hypothetical protein